MNIIIIKFLLTKQKKVQHQELLFFYLFTTYSKFLAWALSKFLFSDEGCGKNEKRAKNSCFISDMILIFRI